MYLAEGESLLRETRATGLFYFPGPVLFLLIFAFLTYAAGATTYKVLPPVPFLTNALGTAQSDLGGGHHYVLIAFAGILIIGLLWLAWRYLRWTRTVYAVTSHRVILQAGILSRSFDEIPIQQVRGVDVHQSVAQRILGYGSVKISAEGGSQRIGNESWMGIPRPFDFQRIIETANQNINRGFGRP